MKVPSMYNIVREYETDVLFYNTNTSCVRIYSQQDYQNYLNGDFKLFDEFIVDKDMDEFKLVADDKIGYINKKKDYLRFTIFPTMKCNARCAFCYENEENRKDMDEQHIADTINFIKKEIKDYKKLRIYWFGGEPLTRIDIMKKISKELIDFCNENQISYKASMATNLSLLDKHNCKNIIEELKIDKIEFAFDGVKDEHNKNKNYKDDLFNAYEHNLNMLPLLLQNNIEVQLRLNCTVSNFDSLVILLDDLMNKYSQYKNFVPYFAMIFPTKYFTGNGDLIDSKLLAHYKLKILEIMRKYSRNGMKDFPLSRNTTNCYGSNPNSIVISPTGILTKCQGCTPDKSQSIGNVKTGITKNYNYYNWCYSTYTECYTCSLYPICMGGCTYSYISNKQAPCIKEKFYIKELLDYVYKYMKVNNITEYKYLSERQKNV